MVGLLNAAPDATSSAVASITEAKKARRHSEWRRRSLDTEEKKNITSIILSLAAMGSSKTHLSNSDPSPPQGRAEKGEPRRRGIGPVHNLYQMRRQHTVAKVMNTDK